MADLTFSVHPVELANALFNAVEVSKDAGGRPGCPHVMICHQPDDAGEKGLVIVYGIGRIVGGRTTLTLDSAAPEGYASVSIPRERAQELQSLLRGQGGGKAARVSVRICEEGLESVGFDEDGEPDVGFFNLIVTNGSGPFVELADSDPEREWDRHFDLIDSTLATKQGPREGPVAFSLEGMDRVTALKGVGTKILDLAGTSRPQVVAVAVGPGWRGIMGTIDAGIYAAGGEDHDAHLFTR